MAKISACIISFNEEDKIEDCLLSLQGIVDEIIVVDSLSTDSTIEIVSRYTDKIFHQKFLGHIEQKTLALSKTQYDWVLSLDCDERLSSELRDSIQAIKGQLGEQPAGYYMPRKSFYIYRWLNYCWYPDKKLRLFNKRYATWGGVNPHDRVLVDDNRVQDLKGDILHYSFDSLSEHIQTIDKFTEIGAQEIIKRGKSVNLFSPFTHGIWTFIRLYFIRRACLDGFAGLVASVLSFMHAFVKYSKVIMYNKRRALKK